MGTEVRGHALNHGGALGARELVFLEGLHLILHGRRSSALVQRLLNR
jgi:hypothetical protein